MEISRVVHRKIEISSNRLEEVEETIMVHLLPAAANPWGLHIEMVLLEDQCLHIEMDLDLDRVVLDPLPEVGEALQQH
jgi:hypothetical protein